MTTCPLCLGTEVFPASRALDFKTRKVPAKPGWSGYHLKCTVLDTENLEVERPQEVHNLIEDMDILRNNSEQVTVMARQPNLAQGSCQKRDIGLLVSEAHRMEKCPRKLQGLVVPEPFSMLNFAGRMGDGDFFTRGTKTSWGTRARNGYLV